MNTIVSNEIEKLIGRQPTDEELQSCLDYLDENVDTTTIAIELPGFINDWKEDNMAQCVNCGQYHLTSEMNHDMYGYYCDDECEYSKHVEPGCLATHDDYMFAITH